MSKYKSRKRSKQSGFQEILPKPILIILGGILLLAAALFAFWRSQQPATATVPMEVSGQPSLMVDQEVVDLGDVKLGKKVSVSFTLANVGDKTLNFDAQPYVEVVEGC